jgi:hypothetical protein
MKGHHPAYNKWVTDMLREATPDGIRPDEALRRIERVLSKVDAVLEESPMVLSYGPGILHGPEIVTGNLPHLSFDWN